MTLFGGRWIVHIRRYSAEAESPPTARGIWQPMKLILWTLAIDDDCSTRADVFTTEREAHLARFAAIAHTTEDLAAMTVLYDDGKQDELQALIEELKKEEDTYNVARQELEVRGLTVVGPGMVLLS